MTPEDDQIVGELVNKGMLEAQVNSELSKRDLRRVVSVLKDPQLDLKEKLKYAEKNGVRGVRYSDGRKFRIDTYMDMAVTSRTRSAMSIGTLTASERRGILAYRISDGPECGLTSHNDGQTANGMVVSKEDAMTYVLSHPYCVREFIPLKDEKKPSPVNLALGLRRRLAGAIPLGLPPAPALAAGAVGGIGIFLMTDANLRRKLIDVALKTNPLRKMFEIKLKQVFSLMERQGLAEVFDIVTGQPLPLTIDMIREEVASYADEVIEEVRDIPEHVAQILNLSVDTTKKVVGDTYEFFSDFTRFGRASAVAPPGIVPGHLPQIVDEFGTSAARFSPRDFVRLQIPKPEWREGWIGLPLPNARLRIPPSIARRLGIDLPGGVRLSIPQIGDRILRDRAFRVALHPSRLIRVTGTIRPLWDHLGDAQSWRDVLRFIPNFRINPNGMLRAGFRFVDGKLLPNLSLVGKGPIRIFTKLNAGGSLTTQLRLVTKGWFNFSINTNLNLDVIREAMGKYGLLDLRDFTTVTGVRRQFELARVALRGQLSELEWHDFNIRSLAAELRIYGWSVFDISRVFRIKWEDSLALIRRAEEFLGETLDRAMVWYRQRRFGADILDFGIRRRIDLYGKDPSIALQRHRLSESLFPDRTSIEFGSDTLVQRSQKKIFEDAGRVARAMEELFPGSRGVEFTQVLNNDFMAYYNYVARQIRISESMRNEYLGKSLQEFGNSARVRHFFRGLDPLDHMATITHEFGHHLDGQLTTMERFDLWMKIRESSGWKKLPIPKTLRDLMVADYSQASRAAMQLVRESIADQISEAWHAELVHNARFVAKDLGSYATKNVQELIAESFSSYMHGRTPTALGQKVGSYFLEKFGVSAPRRSPDGPFWWEQFVKRGLLGESGAERMSQQEIIQDLSNTIDSHLVLRDIFQIWKRSLETEIQDSVRQYTTSAYNLINTLSRRGSFDTLSENMFNWWSGLLPRHIRDEFGFPTKVVDKDLLLEATSRWGMDLDLALSRAHLPEEVVVWRGVTEEAMPSYVFDAFDTSSPQNEALLLLNGKEFVDKGFVSTTLSKERAVNWALDQSVGAILYRITVPKGYQAAYLTEVLSQVNTEWELLLKRGTRFRVTGVDLISRPEIVNLEVLP